MYKVYRSMRSETYSTYSVAPGKTSSNSVFY